MAGAPGAVWRGRSSRGSIAHSALSHLKSVNERQYSFRSARAGHAAVQRCDGGSPRIVSVLSGARESMVERGNGGAMVSKGCGPRGACWARWQGGADAAPTAPASAAAPVEGKVLTAAAMIGVRGAVGSMSSDVEVELARTAARGSAAPVAAGTTGGVLLRCNGLGCACGGAAG